MSWLLGTKVLPPLLGGNPPDLTQNVSDQDRPTPVAWRIAWNDRRIGTAASLIFRRDPVTIVHRHVVHFQQLPLEAMLSESFGLFGAAFGPLLGNDSNVELDLLLATELRFDREYRFTDFHTAAEIGGMQEQIHVRGFVDESQNLKLTTHVSRGDGSAWGQTWHHEIRIPREALIGDAFAPRSELRNLQVGQKWTMPVYRPIPGNNSVQMIEAVADRLEVIVWDAKDVETVLVEYREEAGSGLHTSREPVAQEWVRADDGLVLQRSVRVSNLKILFERLNPTILEPEIDMLDSNKFPHLWSR